VSRVDIRVEAPLIDIEIDEIRRVIMAALAAEEAELVLSCTIVDDRRIHEVNRRFLDHDWATDVITFDLRDDATAAEDDEAEALDGEILVSAATALREARERGHDAATELLFYCVHGVLHLLGWDDHDEPEREAMLSRQAEILARVGYGIEA
jgi:probable rRNA maturation factor